MPELPPRYIEMSTNPVCSSLPLRSLNAPSGDHFIRNHFDPPVVTTSSWTVIVSGEVYNPIYLSYEKLLKLPPSQVLNVMECAGNSRLSMQPPTVGVQWDHGAVGQAQWTGVLVKNIIDLVSPRQTVSDILFEGGDCGKVLHCDKPVPFGISIPISALIDNDAILAYRMNGSEIPLDHGYPVRLVMPSWYGMASVKWLKRMIFLNRPAETFHELDYRIYPASDDINTPIPKRVTSLKTKALISEPSQGDVLYRGIHKITGIAWSGEASITRVDISTDGNKTWLPAELEDPTGSYSLQRWNYDWCAATIGNFLISCRATDDCGYTQPVLPNWNFRGYEVNSIHSISIQVSD